MEDKRPRGLSGDADKGFQIMKMCDECGLFPAEIHLTRIIEQKTESVFLCSACAQKRGIHAEEETPDTQDVSFESAENRECAGCKTTLSEFRGNGLLGCPDCYSTFEKEIELLLRQVHGSAEYLGNKCRLKRNVANDATGITTLRRALDDAIKNEDFERAAVIRDEIRGLNMREGRHA
jgi:protein arginine kinase activator